ncbi:hypothetical protein ACFPN2_24150 [Steroidobacter flavus]|uniref:Uncharacterized protein n=1 Tax=Steroidobacter flavus TaxID=1842136 RepID=A0ABV8SX62_9GAMM
MFFPSSGASPGRVSRYWLIVAASLALPPVSNACVCQPAPKIDPAKVKKSVEWLLTNRTNVLRVRALRRVSDKDFSFEFAVIESWKGDYKPGDAIVASSIAFVDCREAVSIGDDLVVSFNELDKANFAKDTCPDRFQERRRELEAEYLKKLSPKYRSPDAAG